MTVTPSSSRHSLDDLLPEGLRIGAPAVAGPLAVFPLFGPSPGLTYRSFAQASGAGAVVKELEAGASVNDLVVVNGTDHALLLYEGEEVLGAQQNRTFDTSVLIAAGQTLQVPVSCVEHGRWDGARHGDAFAAAPQTAYPELRRAKNQQVRERVAAGGDARASQGAVWSEVASKSERLSVASPTDAMHDVYEQRRDTLRAFEAAVPLHDGQTGMLAAIEGKLSVLDHVSRPDVFASLHGPLLHGYALDAVEHHEGATPSPEEAASFVEEALGAPLSERDGIGLGRDARFATAGVSGAALLAGEELIQLSAFFEDGTSATEPRRRRSARVARPSRRRA